MKKLLLIALLVVGCNETTEPQDCAGVAGGTAELDNCNVCDTDLTNDCVPDCAGVWGGESVDDCNGVCGGGDYVDACGICGGDGVDADADAICDSEDACVSTGAESLVYDAEGNILEDTFLAGYDQCGICNGNGCHQNDCTTYPQSDFDCSGLALSLFGGSIPEEYNIHSIYPNPSNKNQDSYIDFSFHLFLE
mgnify:CR=1 FL=1